MKLATRRPIKWVELQKSWFGLRRPHAVILDNKAFPLLLKEGVPCLKFYTCLPSGKQARKNLVEVVVPGTTTSLIALLPPSLRR
jgi:hypothetical protein